MCARASAMVVVAVRKVTVIACAPILWILFIAGIAFDPHACIHSFEAWSTTDVAVALCNCLAAEGGVIRSRLCAMAAGRTFAAALPGIICNEVPYPGSALNRKALPPRQISVY